MAPTCQATDSNANCVHGGEKPPFVDYFDSTGDNVVYDVLQSEQGTRFFSKRNRNTLVFTDKVNALPLSHKWINIEDMLDLLKIDYLVNTDARSVLVCSPWHKTVGRTPFSRYRNGFGVDLAQSANEPVDAHRLQALKNQLGSIRDKINSPEIIDIEKLDAWKIDDEGVSSISEKSFCVHQIRIQVRGREVPSWDQPIIDSVSEGKVILACGRTEGILRFLFQAKAEAGLCSKVELTPTVVVEPGSMPDKNSLYLDKGVIRAQCRQSEEGGRFFQDTNLFQVVDVGEAYDVPPGFCWLTLAEIRKLLDEEGWFTNEARSALSLLLPWM